MQNSTNSPDCFASTYYEKVSIQIVQKFKRRKLETETLNNNYTVFSVRNSEREVPRYENSKLYANVQDVLSSKLCKFFFHKIHNIYIAWSQYQIFVVLVD